MGTSSASITVAKLQSLLGTLACPVIVDLRIDEDFDADKRLIPTSSRRDFRTVQEWGRALAGRSVVLSCQGGLKISQGAAAWLRTMGIAARTLEGGFEAWRDSGGPLVPQDRIPSRGAEGHTLWVTRERPKIDRIACPWLIRRFIDPQAVFLFVEASQVLAVADRFGATPFDIEGVSWSHRDDRCTFDTMVEEFALTLPALSQLATIVRGADTARLDLAPQAAGLLAVSLGLSQMFDDDLQQLDAGMTIYDALYRWCRDAAHETHNWPAVQHA